MRAMVVLLVLGLVGLARADAPKDGDAARARDLGDAALRKLDDGDYGGASDLFRQAYELTHELPYLVNMGVTLRKARLPHQAVAVFRQAITEGGAQLTPELRAQMESDIEKMTHESAQARVRTEGPAAEILLDDRVVGSATRDAPLFVLIATDASRVHTLTARRPGYRDATQALEQNLEIDKPFDVELAPSAIPTTGRVDVVSVPAGATLRGFGALPRTLELPPGDVELFATLRGHESASLMVHVVAGESRSITLRLRAIQPTWWQRHRWHVAIGAAILGAVAGGVAIRQALEPHYGVPLNVP